MTNDLVEQIAASAPDHIWLDLGEEVHLVEEGTTFKELGGVTWSEDNATGQGIKYVRATPPAAIPAAPRERETFDAWLAREAGPNPSASRVQDCRMGWLGAIAALTQPTTVQRAETEEIVANWVAEQWHAEVANRPLVNVHRKRLDDKWRQLLERLHVDHRARLGPTHDELTAQTTALPGGNGEGG